MDMNSPLSELQRQLLLVSFGLLSCVFAIGIYFGFSGSSEHLHSTDPLLDYFLGVGVAVLILISIPSWPVPKKHKSILINLWFARICITLGFMLIYESFYPVLDAHSYFHHGLALENPLSKFVFGDGTNNIYALSAVINAIIPNSYHATKVIFSLIGLIGIYVAYSAVVVFLGREKIKILYMLGLFPSILFFSSILGKEPVVLLGISTFMLGVIGYYKTQHPKYLILAVAGFFLMSSIRQWLAIIFTLPLGFFVLKLKNKLVSFLLIALMVVPLSIIATTSFTSLFKIETTEDLVNKTSDISTGFAAGGSANETVALGSVTDMIVSAPFRAFTALFRPFPGEVMNAFGLLVGLENLYLMLLLFKGWGNKRRGLIKPDPIIKWLVVQLLVWSLVYGFVSSSNFGGAIRYKLQVTPMLMLVCLYVAYPSKRRGRRVLKKRSAKIPLSCQ